MVVEYIWIRCCDCGESFKKRKADYVTQKRWGVTEFRCKQCALKKSSKSFNKSGRY